MKPDSAVTGDGRKAAGQGAGARPEAQLDPLTGTRGPTGSEPGTGHRAVDSLRPVHIRNTDVKTDTRHATFAVCRPKCESPFAVPQVT